jgi:hypothetical protein
MTTKKSTEMRHFSFKTRKIRIENKHFSHMTTKEKYREEPLQPHGKKRKAQRRGTSATLQEKKSTEKRHFSHMTRK